MTRKTVKMSQTIHQNLCDYADKKKIKSLGKAIQSLLNKNKHTHALELEVERLKEQVAVEPQDEDTYGDPEISCYYGAWNHQKKLVECSKDFSKKGKIYEVSLESCKRCSKRRQAVKQRQPQSTSPLQAPIKNYYCSFADSFFGKLEALPCLENPMFNCKNTKCHEEIMKLIGA